MEPPPAEGVAARPPPEKPSFGDRLREFEAGIHYHPRPPNVDVIKHRDDATTYTAPTAPMDIGGSTNEEITLLSKDSESYSPSTNESSATTSRSAANALRARQAAAAPRPQAKKRPGRPKNTPTRYKKPRVEDGNDDQEVFESTDVRATRLVTIKLTTEKLSGFAPQQTSSSGIDTLLKGPFVGTQQTEDLDNGIREPPIQRPFVAGTSTEREQKNTEHTSTKQMQTPAAPGHVQPVNQTHRATRSAQARPADNDVLDKLCIHVYQIGSACCHFWLHLAQFSSRDELFARINVVVARFSFLKKPVVCSISIFSPEMNMGYNIDVDKDGIAGEKAFEGCQAVVVVWKRESFCVGRGHDHARRSHQPTASDLNDRIRPTTPTTTMDPSSTSASPTDAPQMTMPATVPWHPFVNLPVSKRTPLTIERALGFWFERGISRPQKADRPYFGEAIPDLLHHIALLNVKYRSVSKKKIGESHELQDELTRLFNQLAPRLWPDYPARQQAFWLIESAAERNDPLYPRDLFASKSDDAQM
nr:hypothetical protein CFP56_10233 [Quercus suber]